MCAALVSGNIDAPALAYNINAVMLESYISALEQIAPRGFRIGGGKEEPDGAVSFLVRFVGREQGITGELFVRLEEQQTEKPPAPVVPPAENPAAPEDGTAAPEAAGTPPPAAPPVESRPVKTVWVFEELILETARSREEENAESGQRFDFSPYQRFF